MCGNEKTALSETGLPPFPGNSLGKLIITAPEPVTVAICPGCIHRMCQLKTTVILASPLTQIGCH